MPATGVAAIIVLTRSTVETNDTIKWEDGNEYPLYKLDISSASHPFFTGKMKFLDTTGRVEKFQKKYQKSGYAGKAPGQAEAAATPEAK